MAYPRAKPPSIGAKAPFPGFVEPGLASKIEKVPAGDRPSDGGLVCLEARVSSAERHGEMTSRDPRRPFSLSPA